MKYSQKIYILILLSLILAFTCIGCSIDNDELNELIITIGMGIDKDLTDPELVRLTAQIVNPSELKSASKSDGEKAKGYFNIQSTGQNSFDAIREFTHIVDSRLYMAHTVVFVIGNDAAKDGIGKPLDFFIRSIETRPLTKIIIAEGTAAKALDIQPNLDTFPAISIDQLIDSQIFNSHTTKATIKDYISTMVNKTSSFTAPILKIEKLGDEDILTVKGIAVFKGDKMIGELSKNDSRGLLWVTDLVQSGVVNVEIDEGNAGLEIINVSNDLSVEIHDQIPTAKIEIDVKGSLATQTCKRNLQTLSGIEELEELFQEAIEKEIRETFKKAQKMNADIYCLGQEFQKQYKKEWSQMEDEWNEIFPNLELDIEITGKIVSTGTIIRPVYPEEEKEN